MRIAAIGDLHFARQGYDRFREQMSRVRDEADVLVLAGDLTNFGEPQEMESLINALLRLRIATVAVLGNHDYESGHAGELMKMMTDQGIKVLDGTAYERDGVGFAGAKGFGGGFGRGALTAFGEPEVKAFVQGAIDESLKLERALAQLRTPKRVVVLHYSPVVATVAVRVWRRSSTAMAPISSFTATLTVAAPRAKPRLVVRFTTWRWDSTWHKLRVGCIESWKCEVSAAFIVCCALELKCYGSR
jgi:Icc-related predicted phosphoesterase